MAVEGDARAVGGDAAVGLLGAGARRIVGDAHIGVVRLLPGAEHRRVPTQRGIGTGEVDERGAARGGAARRQLHEMQFRAGVEPQLQRLEVTGAGGGLQQAGMLDARAGREAQLQPEVGERVRAAEVMLDETQLRAGADFDDERRMADAERHAGDFEVERGVGGDAQRDRRGRMTAVEAREGEVGAAVHGIDRGVRGDARLGRSFCLRRWAARQRRGEVPVDEGPARARGLGIAEQRTRRRDRVSGERGGRRPLQPLEAAQRRVAPVLVARRGQGGCGVRAHAGVRGLRPPLRRAASRSRALRARARAPGRRCAGCGRARAHARGRDGCGRAGAGSASRARSSGRARAAC